MDRARLAMSLTQGALDIAISYIDSRSVPRCQSREGNISKLGYIQCKSESVVEFTTSFRVLSIQLRTGDIFPLR
jgi:hypothetical protein